MSFLHRVELSVQENRSLLCVGLDPDVERLPEHLPKNIVGVKEFLGRVIPATSRHAVAYKPNLAFYASLGSRGIGLLKRVIRFTKETHPVILDAKFGDIGNTARHYARFAFDILGADAVTLSPYMGSDSLAPFLEREDGFSFILGITSNPGAEDIQKRTLVNGSRVFERFASTLEKQFPGTNWGWVAGATQVEEMAALREASPSRWFLIPGIGEQGGALREAIDASRSPEGKPLAVVNVSRSILYASRGRDFAEAAGLAAEKLVEEIRRVSSPGVPRGFRGP